MSTADRILGAKLAAIAGRHCGRGRIDDLDAAAPELREVAGNRPDLLAEMAGISLGLGEVGIQSFVPRYRAEAELARGAGADEVLVGRWIEIGREQAA